MNPPVDPKLLAQRELAVPGRYQLSDDVPVHHVNLWERILNWLADRLNDFWHALFGRVHLSANGATLFGDVLIVAIGALVIFAIFRLLVHINLERDPGDTTENTLLTARRSAHALYQQAVALAEQGAFAAAVRVLFLASIVALDLRGFVRDDASSTVGDVRRHLRETHADLIPAFERVARPFVTAAYAEIPITTTMWEEANSGYLQLFRESGT